MIFITGGARSGKSTFAERCALGSGKEVIYIATSPVVDDETRLRIAAHRRRRPGNWITVEEPLWLEKVFVEYGTSGRLLLVDCLTLWLTNHLLRRAGFDGENLSSAEEADAVLRELLNYVRASTEVARQIPADAVLVSNEVGMGLVPENRLNRVFRDLVGKANQYWAAVADEVYVLFAGLPLRLK